MNLAELLPHSNAVLNATSTLALCAGFVAIRGKRIALHRACMISAVIASAVFLAGYLTRFALTGTHRFPDVGVIKSVYLAILFSHMLLDVAVVPIVFRLLFLARRGRFEEHKKLARYGCRCCLRGWLAAPASLCLWGRQSQPTMRLSRTTQQQHARISYPPPSAPPPDTSHPDSSSDATLTPASRARR